MLAKTLVLSTALLTGCAVVDANLDVAQACVTYKDMLIDAAPAAGMQTLNQNVSFNDLGPVKSLVQYDASLVFIAASARATSGVSDFSFVNAAHVTVASGDAGSTLPTLQIFNCDGDCMQSDGTLVVPAPTQASAVDYLKSNSLIFGVDITGTLPTQSWTMDVDVCFSGHAAYTVKP